MDEGGCEEGREQSVNRHSGGCLVAVTNLSVPKIYYMRAKDNNNQHSIDFNRHTQLSKGSEGNKGSGVHLLSKP